MFQHLGQFVTRRSGVVLTIWLLLVACALGVMHNWFNRSGVFPWHVPVWEEVVKDGEAFFLPATMPSKVAERLFEEAIPHDLLASSVVIVVEHQSKEIDDKDKEFIEKILTPALEEIQAEKGAVISGISNFTDSHIGELLMSDDRKASLVIVNLSTEFLAHKNRFTITEIEKLIDPHDGKLATKIPPGVVLSLSGSATVGRDMMMAAQDSASDTERWTIVLVVGLLLLIYRAPLLALIPLITVFVAVNIAMAIIILLSAVPGSGFAPFDGLKIYITVVAYGAGVDYCLFLVARYKEELDRTGDLDEALSTTLAKTGAALTASAGTVACGIGMMVFAQFGKFQQAGKGMALSLILMLIASLTFTPALLHLAGKWAFWPYGRRERVGRGAGWISATSVIDRMFDRLRLYEIWERIGRALLRKPGRIWLACVAGMLPFAVVGVVFHDVLSYGLLSELPKTKQSVIGAEAVKRYFEPGNAGPVTVLLENRSPKVDLGSGAGWNAIKDLTDHLAAEKDKLGIADIRSYSKPMGLNHARPMAPRALAKKYYVSQEGELAGHVTRLDLVFQTDPFSRDSIGQLDALQREIRSLLSKPGAKISRPVDEADAAEEEAAEDDEPPALDYIVGSKVHFLGTTPSIRDLKTITDHDEIVIDTLVLLVVFAILVVLLRKPAISAYLILSVFFSYFAALGATFVVFWALDPSGFAGLDWKVPMFLFTILIAVGEDYNIFLMTRIEEEQFDHGMVEGVHQAQLKTGGIISSCGVIMAGTFFSLVIAGSLVGMQQLGFALSLGVLLDTFLVRPVLVPAYLIMLYGGYFGRFGKFLGNVGPPSKGGGNGGSEGSVEIHGEPVKSEVT